MMQSPGPLLRPILSESAVYAPVFTVELFTVSKTWKQTKSPSTEEGIKKMWYTHTDTQTLEYYLAIKEE